MYLSASSRSIRCRSRLDSKRWFTETVFLTRDDMEVSIGIGDSFLTVTTDGEAEVQALMALHKS
jgi:hypothetical protein